MTSGSPGQLPRGPESSADLRVATLGVTFFCLDSGRTLKSSPGDVRTIPGWSRPLMVVFPGALALQTRCCNQAYTLQICFSVLKLRLLH